jgi:hypothetical protein
MALNAAAAPDMAGSEIPRPAASAVISIFQPWPTRSAPPITRSIGMKTSLPQLGPFWNVWKAGRWRRPISTPAVSVGTRAQVMPISSTSPSRWSGSRSLKARPSTVQTGPRVM